MKIVIIYKSKTGFTKKYAEWIQEEIKCDIIDFDKFSKKSVLKYDLIIYGGRVHAGKIDGLKKVATLAQNNNKKIIVFATGATPINAEDEISTLWKNNLSGNRQQLIPHFYMQSGLNYEKMGCVDKLIMKTVSKILSKKSNKNEMEQSFENAISSSHDISSYDYIKPLLNYLKELQ